MGKILRRTFLFGTAAIAGGVAFGYYKYKTPYDNPLEDDLADGEATFNPYVTITKDNVITVIVPRAEMGQGVTTTLAAMVAEELDVTLAQIKVEHGPASYAYYNDAAMEGGSPFPHFRRDALSEALRGTLKVVGKFLALQVTGGSTSSQDAYMKMRQAGCAAREMLKAAAAEKTGTDIADLKTENGHVLVADVKIPYGELVMAAAKIDPPTDFPLRKKSEWKLLGKSQVRTDLTAKVTGAPIFGIDVELPDMVYGTVRMNPRLGGAMKSFDATDAMQVPGVIKIVDMSGPENEAFGGGIGVIATNTWAAFKGAEAVQIEWGDAPYPSTTDGIFKIMSDTASKGDGDVLRDDGDVDIAFADAPREELIKAEYRVPYLAHTCMEPMNATAHFRDGRLDIWSPNQAPTLIRSDCAFEVGIDEENVLVHTTYMGGGFGRRAEVDFSRYAARLAKHSDGKPVKVVWSREEDVTHDTYRPGAIGQFTARINKDGPSAIEATISSPSIMASFIGRAYPSLSPAGPDRAIGDGTFDEPYSIASMKVTAVKAPIDIPIGFWRSVGYSFNPFMSEGFLDEIAHASKLDPVAMRLTLMKDHPTAVKAVEKVSEMSNWSALAVPGRAKGMAFCLSFGTWVAQVVEVSDQDGEIKIENVWCAADPGTVLDPGIFAKQMQSGIIYGLSSALGQEITFEDGMVEQSNFDNYDAMRINQCPKIHVELLENAEHLGGAGEPGTPPSIPALANAIFALTGKRIRTMPLSNEVDFV